MMAGVSLKLARTHPPPQLGLKVGPVAPDFESMVVPVPRSARNDEEP